MSAKTPGQARAPFTPGQVASLNGFQASGAFHPFTCGNDLCPGVDGQHAVLVAAEDGWHCPACTYTQDWAHAQMADGSWEQWRGITVQVNGGPPILGEVGSVVARTPGQAARAKAMEIFRTEGGPALLVDDPLPREADAWEQIAGAAWTPERDRLTAVMAERDDLRALVTEIRTHLADAGLEVDEELQDAWWERAGIGDEQS